MSKDHSWNVALKIYGFFENTRWLLRYSVKGGGGTGYKIIYLYDNNFAKHIHIYFIPMGEKWKVPQIFHRNYGWMVGLQKIFIFLLIVGARPRHEGAPDSLIFGVSSNWCSSDFFLRNLLDREKLVTYW